MSNLGPSLENIIVARTLPLSSNSTKLCAWTESGTVSVRAMPSVRTRAAVTPIKYTAKVSLRFFRSNRVNRSSIVVIIMDSLFWRRGHIALDVATTITTLYVIPAGSTMGENNLSAFNRTLLGRRFFMVSTPLSCGRASQERQGTENASKKHQGGEKRSVFYSGKEEKKYADESPKRCPKERVYPSHVAGLKQLEPPKEQLGGELRPPVP